MKIILIQLGVELGSELSNRSYYLKGYNINDYINFAQRCSKILKTNSQKLKSQLWLLL